MASFPYFSHLLLGFAPSTGAIGEILNRREGNPIDHLCGALPAPRGPSAGAVPAKGGAWTLRAGSSGSQKVLA